MRRKKKDQAIGDVLSNLGFAFEVFKVIVHAVLAKGGTMQHLRRIVNEPALQRSIADLVVPAGSEIERPLVDSEYRNTPTNGNAQPPNHYRVPVTYAPMPSFDALEKEWGGRDNVSVIFDGRPFHLDASCVDMDRTPGMRAFYVHDVVDSDWWRSESQIVWGAEQRNAAAPNGYRPATHEETYEFAKAHPELVDFVGLGSFAVFGDSRSVAHVRKDGGKRVLGHGWFSQSRWRSFSTRVLFVSK